VPHGIFSVAAAAGGAWRMGRAAGTTTLADGRRWGLTSRLAWAGRRARVGTHPASRVPLPRRGSATPVIDRSRPRVEMVCHHVRKPPGARAPSPRAVHCTAGALTGCPAATDRPGIVTPLNFAHALQWCGSFGCLEPDAGRCHRPARQSRDHGTGRPTSPRRSSRSRSARTRGSSALDAGAESD
jgi:hypothetical protein